MRERRPSPPLAHAEALRRRLRLLAVVLVVAWAAIVAVVGAVASGRLGDLGLPDGQGRPRGLLVVGGATLVAAVAIGVALRRAGAVLGDLLRAVDQVTAGEYGSVDVPVRGPRELRLLTATFNEMAARLAADQAQRRRFLADITHELRNPLAVLQSEIEAQLDGVHPRDDRHLASLLGEAQRLGHLVDDLHTLALAETGRLVLRPREVAVHDLVDEAVDRHRAQATQRGVALRTAVASGLPPLWADPARARQVLGNLLANAIRHTPAAGEVVVEVAPDVGRGGPRVRCRVADTGPGFREDQLGHLFERFRRAGDTSGSGLGLSIARDLVEAQGGTIEAGNDPRTGGAVVTFTLPACSGGPREVAPPAPWPAVEATPRAS